MTALSSIAVTRAGLRARAGLLVFLAIVGACLLPGLTGHDPWKQDETYITGIVRHMLASGDWLVPTLAGEPFMEKPPLYYWLAAALAWLCAPLLPLHDGARLATACFTVLTCAALAWTARRWWGEGRLAVLALLACPGMMLHAHMMLTDLPLLAGFAVAICGFALCRAAPLRGGLLLGTGAGIGFLAKGVLGPGVIGLSALLLPLLWRDWRSAAYRRALLAAALAALPWLLLWPAALYWRAPDLFMEWFWDNNIGRFVGFSVPLLGAAHEPGFWWRNLPWFTFPALPLALATLWRRRRYGMALAAEPCQVTLVLAGVLLTVLALSASARNSYALPLLAPLALLAAPAAARLPPWLARAWDWAARLLFGTLAALVWLVWLALLVRGAVPSWAPLLPLLPPQFSMPLLPARLALALTLSLAAWTLARHAGPAPARGLVAWSAGMALVWGLVASLWLPWLDHAKSYRAVFASLNAALPPGYRCIAGVGLGESERAMLDYFQDLRTERVPPAGHTHCDLLLVYGKAGAPPRLDPLRWQARWDGARPGDREERFWLFAAGPPQP